MSDGLDRRVLIAALVDAAGDALFVAGLGSPAWDLAAAGDRGENFYLWGGMGQAAMVGLGLALAQPKRRVVSVTGDGEILMGLGALSAIAAKAPENFALLVLDNETYGETGGQPSATRGAVDLVGIARASGIADAEPLTAIAQAGQLVMQPGPVFRLAKIAREPVPLVLPPRDGAFLKDRMRQVLGV